jgi:hypothetical protein
MIGSLSLANRDAPFGKKYAPLPTEISRIYADVLCLRCTLRPFCVFYGVGSFMQYHTLIPSFLAALANPSSAVTNIVLESRANGEK